MKYLNYLIIFILISCLVACRGSQKSTYHKASTKKLNIDVVLKRAKKQMGVKYKLGGKTPSGFDCSGFTIYCFEPITKLPATAAQQGLIGNNISPKDARKGDLIFFKGGNAKSKEIGHVGIIVSGKGMETSFIHASSSKGIMISKLNEKYFSERFVRIRRIN
jgi:cell wall-associated NlpC family hydrolase